MSAIWKSYDKAALDAQYFLRARVPGFQAYFDSYRVKSMATRDFFQGRLDIAYGDRDGQVLDIFPAHLERAPKGGHPVHVFIHGGYWQSMAKSDFSYIAAGFFPAGVTTVIVDYPLAPKAGIDDIVASNRLALAWVWRNIAAFGGNPDRITVSGHSAGGHLTAMMMLTDWRALAPDLPADLVKAGMAVSGIFELEPIRLCYLNDVLKMDAEAARRNAPMTLLEARERAPDQPIVLTLGGDETDEYHRMTREFAALWTRKGGKASILDRPGLHHFDIVDELGQKGSVLNGAMLGLIGGA